MVAVPLLPLLTMLYVNVTLSGSLAVSVPWAGVSSLVTTELEVAAGTAELVIAPPPPPSPPPPPPPPQPATEADMINISKMREDLRKLFMLITEFDTDEEIHSTVILFNRVSC
jgi:hypothetical protein